MTTKKASKKEFLKDYSELVEKFEKRLATKVPKSIKDGYAVFYVSDNFTNVVIYNNSKTNSVVGVGSAKRNPKDNYNLEVGKNVALWHVFEATI